MSQATPSILSSYTNTLVITKLNLPFFSSLSLFTRQSKILVQKGVSYAPGGEATTPPPDDENIPALGQQAVLYAF